MVDRRLPRSSTLPMFAPSALCVVHYVVLAGKDIVHPVGRLPSHWIIHPCLCRNSSPAVQRVSTHIRTISCFVAGPAVSLCAIPQRQVHVIMGVLWEDETAEPRSLLRFVMSCTVVAFDACPPCCAAPFCFSSISAENVCTRRKWATLAV